MLKRVEEAIKRDRKICLENNSNFEPGMCLNGGHYSLWRTFTKIEGTNLWTVEYFCNSEFSTCRLCGQYYQDDEHENCVEETITDEELLVEATKYYLDEEEGNYGQWPALDVLVWSNAQEEFQSLKW